MPDHHPERPQDQPDPPQGCSGCSAECSHRVPDPAPLPIESSETPLLTGWRFALVSFGFFLGPLALAILGAVVFRETPLTQLVGAVGGLLVGMLISLCAVRMTHPPKGRGR